MAESLEKRSETEMGEKNYAKLTAISMLVTAIEVAALTAIVCYTYGPDTYRAVRDYFSGMF